MDDFLTTPEFERYVKQHDDRQERFFVEHNGALVRIGDSIDEVKRLVSDNQRQILDIISAEVDDRKDCGEKFDLRLGCLEDQVSDHEGKLNLPGMLWKFTAAILGLSLVVLTILSLTHVIR